MMLTLLYLTNSSLGPDIKLLTIPTSITPTALLRTILFVPEIPMSYNPYLNNMETSLTNNSLGPKDNNLHTINLYPYNIDTFVKQRYGCLPNTV